MSMAPPVTTSPSTTEQMCSAIERCSTEPSSLLLNNSNIKQEKHDDRSKMEKTAKQQTQNTSSIAFSITNILSNTFGNAIATKLQTTNNNNQINRNNNNKVISEKKNSVLFRPYDDDNCGSENGSAGLTSPKQPKRNDRRQQSDDEESNGECELKRLCFFIDFIYFCFSVARMKVECN